MNAARAEKDRYGAVTPAELAECSDRHLKVLRILSRRRVRRLLDIGCGDGGFSSLLGRGDGRAIVGVDVSHSVLKKARSNGVPVVRSDIDHGDLPFTPEVFDAVFAGEVIEHVFDTDHFLDEIHRILAPGGILVLTTPNLAALHNRVALLLGLEPFSLNPSLRHAVGHLFEPEGVAGQIPSGDHIRVMTLRSLLRLLGLHDFSIEEVHGSGALSLSPPRSATRSQFLSQNGYRVVRALDSLLVHFPRLSFRSIVVARKPGAESAREPETLAEPA